MIMALEKFVSPEIIRTGIMLAVGIPAIWILSSMLKRALKGRVSEHLTVIINTAVFYSAMTLLGISVLNQLGFELSAVLGAAGVIGIGIGFASQTSLSNIISGIFLLLERSISIGDVIICDSIKGKVEAIDLLAVKVRTFDNTLVRIPNEFFVKKAVKNTSFYATKRTDFKVSIPLDQEVKPVLALINKSIEGNDNISTSPSASITPTEFTDAGLNIVVKVWSKQKKVSDVKKTFVSDVNAGAQDTGIKIGVKLL